MIALHHLDCPLRPSEAEQFIRNAEKHIEQINIFSKLYCCKCVCGSTAFNWCKNYIDETGKIIYTINKNTDEVQQWKTKR